MIVYNTFVGDVEVVPILHSTYPSNFMPDRRRYILLMVRRQARMLAISRSGRYLRIHVDE
jgi:hypothetical protein